MYVLCVPYRSLSLNSTRTDPNFLRQNLFLKNWWLLTKRNCFKSKYITILWCPMHYLYHTSHWWPCNQNGTSVSQLSSLLTQGIVPTMLRWRLTNGCKCFLVSLYLFLFLFIHLFLNRDALNKACRGDCVTNQGDASYQKSCTSH